MNGQRFRLDAWTFLLILALGLVLMLPSLRIGFLMDDYFYVLGDRYFPGAGNGSDMFAFYRGDATATAALARAGHCPWWIDDELRLAFLRPLSSMLLKLDAGTFGLAPPGHHAHSLLWWALALTGTGLLLRRSLPGAAGMLALLLFAVDESHIMPAMWVANRNALLALCFLTWALWAHRRGREDGWRPGRPLALAGVVLALLAGEIAVAGLAYFLAYELWGAPGTRRERMAAAAPVVVIVGAYVVVNRALGYGAAASGLYLDPGREPLAYLAAAAWRLPVLLAGGIAGFSADLGVVNERLQPAQVVTGAAALLILAALLRACWPGFDAETRRGLRWLLPGSALSMLPVVAVFPGDRMLLFPELGLAAALAAILQQAWSAWRLRRRRWLVAAGALIFLVHVPYSALVVVAYQQRVREFVDDSLALTRSPLLTGAGDREVVIVNAPDNIVGLYLPLMMPYTNGRLLASWRPLSMAPCDHVLTRPAPRTLVLETTGGGVMHRSLLERLYRSRANRLQPGDVVDRGLVRAEVLAGTDEGPTRVAFHLDRDPEDETLLILIWRNGELRRAELPPVGGRLELPHTPGPVGI